MDSAPLTKMAIHGLKKEDHDRFSPFVDGFNRLVDENMQAHYVDALHEQFGWCKLFLFKIILRFI